MPYIGKQPLTGAYQLCDTITTSATATYNLLVGGSAVIPGSANNCIVSLNGVVQAPVSAFTVSGSTITFSSTLSSSDVIDFILILGNVFDIGTPTNGAVTNSSLNSNVITGQTAETSVAGGDLVLLYDDSASALRKMTRTNFIGGGNTPAFLAYATTATNMPNATGTKITLDNEIYDTDNAFASSRFTVPTGKGGKYFFTAGLRQGGATSSRFIIQIIKNNSGSEAEMELSGGVSGAMTAVASVALNLSATDFVEIFGYQNNGTTQPNATGVGQTWFAGFKLIE
jgi:hypothetical protein